MAEGGWSAAARSSETSFLSELQLLDLSLGICSIWTNVGTRLGLCTATLDNIAGTPALDTPQKRAFRMLTTWHRKQKNASVVQLISALVLEGREDLVQKCLAYQQVSNRDNRACFYFICVYDTYYMYIYDTVCVMNHIYEPLSMEC